MSDEQHTPPVDDAATPSPTEPEAVVSNGVSDPDTAQRMAELQAELQRLRGVEKQMQQTQEQMQQTQAQVTQLSQTVQQQVDAQLPNVPDYMRPLLQAMPPADALAYLQTYGEQFMPRAAPALDGGVMGERTEPLNLTTAQARLMTLAARYGYQRRGRE